MKKEEISEFCQLNLWVLFANNTEIIITNMRTKVSREERVFLFVYVTNQAKIGPNLQKSIKPSIPLTALLNNA